jgi:predicted ribosome quality control (RQC) complex YloA/Tae2 family protein
MYFDAVTIMALVDEFNKTLAGGRVQDTVEIDDDTFGLEIYTNHERLYLLLSAHQQYARAHLSVEKLRRGVQKPSPLGLLLRRYAEGARIESVNQPEWERVISFELDGPEGVFELIIEPMERRANILLVRDDGIIVDCVRRVGSQENRFRVSLPNHPYEVPPPQKTKRDPMELTVNSLGDLLDAEPGEKAQQVLTKKLLGFSPQVAKEVVFRATGETNTKAADTSPRTLLDVIIEMFTAFQAGEWQPGVVVEDELATAFSVYPLTYLSGWVPTETVSAAVEQYYGVLVGEGAYDAAKKPVQEVINEAKSRVQSKLDSLRKELQDEAALEHLKQSGELLLAYQYTIQKGQTVLRAQYDMDGPELEVKIDTSMSPLDNAKHYFERYDKAKRARAGVPDLIKTVVQELDYLTQLEIDLVLASNWPEIGEVQDSLQANGYWRGTKTIRPGGGKSGPLKLAAEDGTVIWVGRNSRQNDIVTFDKGGPEDLWLHVRGLPGAHVIIKSGGRSVPDTLIRQAAAIAAYYSGARNEGRARVDVTQRKYVRKIKGGKPGMVTYRNESPVEVVPKKEL